MSKEHQALASLSSLSFWESNGDYQADALAHEDTQSPLYATQLQLPRLPVPSLQDTVQKFLKTAPPLTTSDAERQALQEAASTFPKQAQHLQERLLKRQQNLSDTSWLQQWWNQLGYLQVRDSNTINVSYFFRENRPNNQVNNKDTHHKDWLDRGASVLRETALYAKTILNNTRPTDRLGRRKIPLCSTQYKYLFQACRIPRLHQDAYRVYQQQQPLYAIVSYRQQFYQVPLYTTTANNEPTLRSHADLRCVLQQIVATASTTTPPLGWLTATDRDTWAHEYQFLLQHKAFAQALDVLQGGLLLLALDDHDGDDNSDGVDSVNLSPSNDDNDATDPLASSFAAQLLHGNQRHTANRWWDKSMQVVLAKFDKHTTRMGYIGEHSMSDGMPATGVWEHLLEHCQDDNSIGNKQDTIDTTMPLVEPIFQTAWESMSLHDQDRLMRAIDKARKEVSGRIHALDCRVLEYTRYGGRRISNAGYSVDAFGQMAMQLASYRAFGQQFVATYESTQTRQFLHGRTETTRSVSPASAAFVHAMVEEAQGSDARQRKQQQQQALLRTACETHVQYSREAAQGMGVDRHFMGLQMLQQPGEAEVDLFRNPTFQESKRWRLSTSTLPGMAPGFGPVQEDGVGVGYDLQTDRLIFNVTGWKKYGFASRMEQCLAQSLDEMEAFLDVSTPSSKL